MIFIFASIVLHETYAGFYFVIFRSHARSVQLAADDLSIRIAMLYPR